jgi:hypothetical protein
LESSALRICNLETKKSVSWFGVCWRKKNGEGSSRKVTPIWIISYFGLEEAVKWLLSSRKAHADSGKIKEVRRMPLLYATIREHNAIAGLLFDSSEIGVDPENEDDKTTPSHVAKRRYEIVVKLLLDSGKSRRCFKR